MFISTISGLDLETALQTEEDFDNTHVCLCTALMLIS